MKKVSKASDIISYKPKPSISINADELPAVKNWKIGYRCKLIVDVKLVSLDGDDDFHDGESTANPRARFRVLKVSEE